MSRSTAGTATRLLALLCLAWATAACSTSSEHEDLPVLEVQADMERQLLDLAEVLMPPATIEDVPAPRTEITQLSPCGGVEGASWSRVLGSYDLDLATPQTSDEATDALTAHLAGTELEVVLPSAADVGRFELRGEGWVGVVEVRPEHSQVVILGETDCLDNPEE